MAALVRHARNGGNDKARQLCGGTLLTPTIVLTANHCLTNEDTGRQDVFPSNLQIVLGRRTLSDDSTGERIDVVDTRLHEGYQPSPLFNNDVALVALARPARQTPATLGGPDDWGPPHPSNGQPWARAMGWGDTFSDSGQGSDDLLAVDLWLWGDEQRCIAEHAGHYFPDTELCAGGQGAATCQGDSGGPLMASDGAGGWKLLGVTSFGHSCGLRSGVYAWAAGPTLRQWILNAMTNFPRPPAPPPPPRDLTSPTISTLSVSPSKFRPAKRGASVAAVGATVRYRLSEGANVVFSVRRRSIGRRSGGRCRKVTRRNRANRRCTRYVPVRGTFVHKGAAGANRFGFTGRMAGRRLSRATYRLRARAVDAAGNRSVSEQVRFRIVGL